MYSRFRFPENTSAGRKAGDSIAGRSIGSFNTNISSSGSLENYHCGVGTSIWAGYHRNFFVSSTSGSVYINYRGRNRSSYNETRPQYVYIGSKFGPVYRLHVYANEIWFHAAYKRAD